MHFDLEASSEGSCCPVPLIKLEEAITRLEPGKILKMVGDDPIFEEGVRDYCSLKNYEILNVEQGTNNIAIYIRV